MSPQPYIHELYNQFLSTEVWSATVTIFLQINIIQSYKYKVFNWGHF